MANRIVAHFHSNRGFELEEIVPSLLLPKRQSRWYLYPNSLGKLWSHLFGDALTTILPAAANQLKGIEVDWLRVKSLVKVIDEFWAQMTGSNGNFRMLEFLELEGAEVSIDPISTWVLLSAEPEVDAGSIPASNGGLHRRLDKPQESNC
jgi:hypothetical protein